MKKNNIYKVFYIQRFLPTFLSTAALFYTLPSHWTFLPESKCASTKKEQCKI